MKEKYLAVAMILVSSTSVSFAAGSICHVDSLINAKVLQRNAREYQDKYNEAYDSQDKAIKELTQKNKVDPEKANKTYFESAKGKQTEKELKQLKKDFDYDAISSFLFDDEEMNEDAEFYEKIYSTEGRRYYVVGQRIIAKFESINSKQTLLRYNKDCKVKEVVQFNSLRPDSDSQVSFKINKSSCAARSNGVESSDDQAKEFKAYFQAPEDKTAKKEWRLDIERNCRYFGNPTAPQPAKPQSVKKIS